MIVLHVPVAKPAAFRKGLTEWVTKIALAPEKGFQQDREIEGSIARISVVSNRSAGKKIFGCVVNMNSSSDIGLNARLVLEDRIRTKSAICALLPKPTWLALLNDYWLADADTYVAAGRQLTLPHCFDRIFVVADKGAVKELAIAPEPRIGYGG